MYVCVQRRKKEVSYTQVIQEQRVSAVEPIYVQYSTAEAEGIRGGVARDGQVERDFPDERTLLT